MKKIAAIHDMSCFGRCALTVIIPLLSAMGHQVVPIPTALLSTHTGGFEDPYFMDLSDQMLKIVEHFEQLGVKFDAIYSGFLGSARQIHIVEDIIDRFGGNGPVLVDPVMGDDGKLYSTYTDELVRGMTQLCRKADIITPNLTEACFMLGKPYIASGYTKEYIEDMLRELIALKEELAKQNGGASPPSAPAPAPDAADVSVSEAPAEAEKPDGE